MNEIVVYAGLTAPLIRAVKELKNQKDTEILELKKENETIRKENESIKSRLLLLEQK